MNEMEQNVIVVSAVAALATITSNGCTVSMIPDWDQPDTGYSVAMGSASSATIPINYNTEIYPAIKKFVTEHQPALYLPDMFLGTWMQPGLHENTLYLDVVQVFQDRDAAMEAGIRRNQIAIYDLAESSEILTGGTGT